MRFPARFVDPLRICSFWSLKPFPQDRARRVIANGAIESSGAATRVDLWACPCREGRLIDHWGHHKPNWNRMHPVWVSIADPLSMEGGYPSFLAYDVCFLNFTLFVMLENILNEGEIRVKNKSKLFAKCSKINIWWHEWTQTNSWPTNLILTCHFG